MAVPIPTFLLRDSTGQQILSESRAVIWGGLGEFWWHVIGLYEGPLVPTLHLGQPAPCEVRKNGMKGTLGPGLLPTLLPFWN